MRGIVLGAVVLAACSLNDVGSGGTGSGPILEPDPNEGSSAGFEIPELPPTMSGQGGTSTGAEPTTTAGSTGSESSTDEGASESTGAPIVCGEQPPVPEDCAEECTDCEDGTCELACSGMAQCLGQEITCPPDGPCSLICNGPQACFQATIVCPPEHRCEVDCFGDDACAGVELQCGDGPCELQCNVSGTSCAGLNFYCGANDSQVTCVDQQDEPPVIHTRDSGECICDGCFE